MKQELSVINASFPSVTEYEVPAFLADVAWKDPETGTNTLFGEPGDEEDGAARPGRRADNSVYALWIGTNDLGADAFLTDSVFRPGATVARDYADCVWDVFDALYSTGGRHFGESFAPSFSCVEETKASHTGGKPGAVDPYQDCLPDKAFILDPITWRKRDSYVSLST